MKHFFKKLLKNNMAKVKRASQKKTPKKILSCPELLNLANLGNTFLIQGKLNEAIENYRNVLLVKPDFAEVHNNLGIALQQQGKFNLAVECHQRALSIKPDYAQAYLNLGMAFNDLGKFDTAIEHYQQALLLAPNYAEAHYNLGIAFKNQGHFDEAIASYQHTLALNPKFTEAYLNLGTALNELGQFSAAIDCYRQALLLKPDYSEALYNLAIAFKNQGNLDEAVQTYQQTLAIHPNFAKARVNLGFLLLAMGKFAEGWQHNEFRHETNHTKIPTLNFPQWRGEAIHGKSIVIWREQGLGDEIFACRYVAVLKSQGATRISWVCKKPLKSLLSTVKEVEAVWTEEEAISIPPHDYWTFPLSIPLYCRTTLDTIPASIPYLYADPKQAQSIATELSPIHEFKVGLCWKGNPKFKDDVLRSPGITPFKPLFQVAGVKFFNLQPETRLEFINVAGSAAVDRGHEVNAESFDEATALIMNLDLVITSCTSICHLAGALGKPVWIALPFEADWRWLMEREDSPWYPTARLFRQTQRGDWTEVLKQIETELKKVVHPSC